MRRRQPRPKTNQATPIPDALRESMREVQQVIQESGRDPDVRIDFDDAIQTPDLCGGRIGSGNRPFKFTYYHAGDANEKTRWYLAVHEREIEDIADGRLTTLNLYSCDTPKCGHKSTDVDDLCDCDYVDDPHYGNIEFPNAASTLEYLGIKGIKADSPKEDVIEILGEPTLTGGGEKHPSIGYIYPWIKYHRTDCQLRFEFRKSKGIRSISILEPDWEPGK